VVEKPRPAPEMVPVRTQCRIRQRPGELILDPRVEVLMQGTFVCVNTVDWRALLNRELEWQGYADEADLCRTQPAQPAQPRP
jgi:hypothetical protein